MNRCLYPAKVLLVGLLTAQVIATIQVFLSNLDLYRSLTAIKAAGYLTIPNHRVMQSLLEVGPAIFGGLFFTLTVGAGLSILGLTAAWIWFRLLLKRKILLVPYFLPWLGLLYEANHRGLSPMVSSYFVVIPVVTFLAASKWMPSQISQRVWLHRAVHSIPIILLAVLWSSQLDSQMFLSLRDNLLLSNSFGMSINDFYYKYNLYPLEVFKSLDEETLKSFKLQGFQQNSIVRFLEKELHNHDYLHVEQNARVDLEIVQQDETLAFKNGGRTILTTSLKNFFSEPRSVLKEFSSLSYRHGFFRQFIFFSLLIGFPITLYVFLFALFCLVLCLFLKSRTSSIIASILCLLAGLASFFFFFLGRGQSVTEEELAQALESPRWQTRVAALKTVAQKKIEIVGFQSYQNLLTSPHIPERYWLVRVLGVSRHPETYRDLMRFLDDPHPNVVCMAFDSLGQRGDTSAINVIIKRIKTSDHWYEQWYAYKALRKLGWKQGKSK